MPDCDVFISYCSQDRPIAEAACDALETCGIGCWIAPRDIRPAQDWSGAIIDAITECRVFLLILSSSSNQSEQVKREIQNAVEEGKHILPFRIEALALSKHMRYFIGTPHWLDALTPPMERHLQKMAEVVSGLIRSTPTEAGELLPLPAVAGPTAGVNRPAPAPTAISPEMVADAGKALAHFLGPVAYALAKRAAKVMTTPDDLYHHLADHLSTPGEKAEFLRTRSR